MERKEYIVSLRMGVDYDQFWHDMETTTNQHPFVPDHSVDIVNNRPGSTLSCHYALTDAEADTLRNDPRVYGVEIPPDQRSDLFMGPRSTQIGNFDKTTDSEGSFKNWGLRRCISYSDPYQGGLTATGDYSYVFDGTGVDIVIQDSGLQVDHPEFEDEFGVSRVQQIDWYAASGLPGTQNAYHYRDYDGHGTHVAGIAAGKTFGWAKNSRIYSLKVRGLEGPSDLDPISGLGTGIPISDCFDVIKLWHQNKPIDPVTGVKRPTVVNMSWGYGKTYTNITGGSYRGTFWSDTSRKTEYGMLGRSAGFNYVGNVRISSVDSDINELIAAGVIVVVAAGNTYEKVDVPGGLDYDNYWTSSVSGNTYYHRGSSPYSDDAIVVASIADLDGQILEVKASDSCHGPGVTVSAPGKHIVSATSNTNKYPFFEAAYYENATFKQLNLSGTSMASPQVAGVMALYLQSHPAALPSEVKTWINSTTDPSQDRIYSTGLDNDYTNTESILGGNQNYLYWPYSTPTIRHRVSNVQFRGPITFKMG